MAGADLAQKSHFFGVFTRRNLLLVYDNDEPSFADLLARSECSEKDGAQNSQCITAVQRLSVDLCGTAVAVDLSGSMVELVGDGVEVGSAELS
jgi:hypothetical protein